MNLEATLAHDGHAGLAEGPAWDGASSSLIWVDIERGLVHTLGRDGADTAIDVGRPVSAAIPRAAGGLVLCLQDAVATLAPGSDVPVDRVAIRSGDRMNDGKCDPLGRLWVGTMRDDGARDSHLYRIDPDWSVHLVLDGIGISNGLGWSPDAETMYYADTSTGRVDVLDYDLGSGTASGRRPWVTVPAADGFPDGLCVDADGGVWLALWEGAAVRRYLPSGEIDLVIPIPAERVTSCCFGGRELRDLYVTTAQPEAPEEDAASPHAGGIFVVRPGIQGLPTTPFAG